MLWHHDLLCRLRNDLCRNVPELQGLGRKPFDPRFVADQQRRIRWRLQHLLGEGGRARVHVLHGQRVAFVRRGLQRRQQRPRHCHLRAQRRPLRAGHGLRGKQRLHSQ